jgi:LacI family transcriptional regulator
MNRIGVREIAAVAKVSIGTVDRALNGRKEISEKTRRRILQIAKDLGYEPNPAARALSVGRSNVKIGVCIPREIEYFYDYLWDGIKEEAHRFRHLGLEILYRPVKNLRSDQTQSIKSLLDDGIQILIVTPGEPASLAPIIDSAEKERNVRVICLATDDSLSCRSTVVSVEPRMNGMLAAELMANFVPACSKVAVVTGMLGTEDHARKIAGFSEVFPQGCPGSEIVAIIEGHEDEDETFQKCRQLLSQNRDLAGIYVSTVNSIPVCRALVKQQLAGRIKVIATDLFVEMVPFLRNGTLTAAIHQRPYLQGQVAVRLALDYCVNGEPVPHTRYLSPAIVMRSNLSLFPEASHSPFEREGRPETNAHCSSDTPHVAAK